MKRSALHRWHEKAGATFAEDNGWYVPLRYSNAEQEAEAVSGNVGICDLSHIHDPLSPYARFLIAGPNARTVLSKLTSLNLDQSTAFGSVAHVRSLVTRDSLGFPADDSARLCRIGLGGCTARGRRVPHSAVRLGSAPEAGSLTKRMWTPRELQSSL